MNQNTFVATNVELALSIQVKFGSDSPYKKLNVFRSAIENFVKARPREVCLKLQVFLLGVLILKLTHYAY